MIIFSFKIVTKAMKKTINDFEIKLNFKLILKKFRNIGPTFLLIKKVPIK